MCTWNCGNYFIVLYMCSDFPNLISQGGHAFLLWTTEADSPSFLLLCWLASERVVVGREAWISCVLSGDLSPPSPLLPLPPPEAPEACQQSAEARAP